MTRLRRLELLLESMNDYLQPYCDPATSKYPGTGAGPERRITCERCKGVRKLLGNGPCIHCRDKSGKRHKCSPCERCKGKGSYFVNSYVGQVEGAPERKGGSGGHRRARKARPHKDMGDIIHRVVSQREEQWARGSYEDVEKALRKLQYEDEVAAYLIKAWHVEGRWRVAPVETHLAIARGMLRMLEITRGSKLRVPSRLMVKELERQGASVNATARELGIRKSKVRKARVS